MALKVADRVKQNTNTTGSGTLALVVSTPAGFQSFSSVLSNSDTTYYVLVENDDFEIGVGTYSSNTLQRSHVLQSSNSDNKINLGGSGTVFIGYPADKSVYQNEESQVVVGASGLILSNSTIIKDGKITELTDVDSSGTPTSTHLMSFNMTNYGLTIGNQTGWSNGNTLIGHQAGSGLTTGSDSTMVGYQAGNRNQAGNNNTFIGHQAGPTHPGVGTTIYNSVALGYQAGNKMGVNSTAIGYQSALSTNNAGFVAVGVSAGSGLGADAVAVGRSAGHDLNEQYAIAVGYQAGYQGGGTSSAWLGHAAGHSSNGATRSIGLGYQAGKSTTGDDCIYLGNSAGQSNTTDDYFYIANAAPASNGTLIKGDMTNKRVAVGKADITLDSTLHVGINTATHVGLIVKSAAAQSADLTQWQNSAGNSLAAMAKSGVLTVNGLYASGAGLQIASVTPAVTTNTMYNIGGSLYFNGSAVGGGGGASATATYASGQALSLTYASGLTATNAGNIVAVSGIANYASGQALSLSHASGIATYASGVVTGGTPTFDDMYVGEYVYHNGEADTYIRFRDDQFDFVAGGLKMLTLDEGSNDKVIVNEGGNNVDFRVEGENDSNLISTDAANDLVGIGTSSPSYKLDVVGYDALVQSSGLIVGNSGIVLANNTPGVTTNTLYNDAGTLSWNGSAVGGGGASATATYASGQALSLTHASGIATSLLTASGTATSLIASSGTTTALINSSGVATYASGVVRGGVARFNKIGINTDTPVYGIQVVGAGASGLIQGTGVIVGNSGAILARNTPGVTTDTLYNVGGTLYFNGSQLASAGGASTTAQYASGQVLSLTYASGLTVTNSAIANYASGQALSFTTASGVANYASGQALSLSHASGVTTSLINSSGVATYASGQALSLTTASGLAAYSSGVVTGGIANLNKLGINTGSPAYGIDVIGAGASGLIQTSGVVVGNSGLVLASNTPGVTTNTLYNNGGNLYFNGSQLASGGGASATATYASGQALSLSHASGVATSLLTASGTATSLIASSGTTTALINSSGVATYASGVVTGGNPTFGDAYVDQYIYHNGDNDTYIRLRTDQIDFNAGGKTFLTLDETTQDIVIVNDGGNDVDLKVESEKDANLFRTDAANDRVGLGTASPAYRLDVVGAGASGIIQSSGILIGASGIGVGTTTPAHPIDVVQHSGVVRASGMHSAISMNADAATVTFDLDQATTHGVTLGNNRTLALSNVQIGDKFLIRLQQDGTGSRTVTWFNHISWAGGSAPTLTTTAHKADIIGFLTASGTGSAYWFDGLVVGQNI